MFDSLSSIKHASSMLGLIAKRQKVLGENLANVDTPGYIRKDIDFNQQLSAASGTSLETKLSSKMGESPMFEKETGEVVNPANEIMALQKNSMMYTMATRQMSSVITMMKSAINVGR